MLHTEVPVGGSTVSMTSDVDVLVSIAALQDQRAGQTALSWQDASAIDQCYLLGPDDPNNHCNV